MVCNTVAATVVALLQQLLQQQGVRRVCVKKRPGANYANKISRYRLDHLVISLKQQNIPAFKWFLSVNAHWSRSRFRMRIIINQHYRISNNIQRLP